MKNKPIKHHIAPKAYLDNFAIVKIGKRSPRLHVLSRQTGSVEPDLRTKDIFYKHFCNHIGNSDQVYESAERDLNNLIEMLGNAVIADLLNGKAIKHDQTRILARYLLFGVLRSLWFHINLRAVYKK